MNRDPLVLLSPSSCQMQTWTQREMQILHFSLIPFSMTRYRGERRSARSFPLRRSRDTQMPVSFLALALAYPLSCGSDERAGERHRDIRRQRRQARGEDAEKKSCCRCRTRTEREWMAGMTLAAEQHPPLTRYESLIGERFSLPDRPD